MNESASFTLFLTQQKWLANAPQWVKVLSLLLEDNEGQDDIQCLSSLRDIISLDDGEDQAQATKERAEANEKLTNLGKKLEAMRNTMIGKFPYLD